MAGGGSGEGGADRAVALVWAAAAAARECAAAAHMVAARTACLQAREAMAEAAAGGIESADAAGRVVGRDGRITISALKDITAALDRASSAQRRARASFREAARRARSAAAEMRRGAEAHAEAEDPQRSQTLRTRAVRARRIARDASKRALSAAKDARTTRKASKGWAACAVEWNDGEEWPGDKSAWPHTEAGIRAGAERERALWAGRVEKAAAARDAAVGGMERTLTAAENAAIEAKRVQPRSAGAKDAYAALGKGRAAAERAAKTLQSYL